MKDSCIRRSTTYKVLQHRIDTNRGLCICLKPRNLTFSPSTPQTTVPDTRPHFSSYFHRTPCLHHHNQADHTLGLLHIDHPHHTMSQSSRHWSRDMYSPHLFQVQQQLSADLLDHVDSPQQCLDWVPRCTYTFKKFSLRPMADVVFLRFPRTFAHQ